MTNDISSEHSLWNRLVLNFRGMLKTSIHNGTEKFGLEKKILEPRGMDTDVVTLLAAFFFASSSRTRSLGDFGYLLWLL